MKFETLLAVIRDVLSLDGPRLVEFVWHGGEVTQLSPAYFNKLIWLQQRFARPGTVVKNLIQTNAVSLSEEWIRFLRAHRISVGVSVDGPPRINDARRVDKAGEGTSARIASNLQLLRKHGINFGALVVVDRELALIPPRELLEYFNDVQLRSASLLNVLPENRADGGEYLTSSEFTRYLVSLYRVWNESYRHKLALQPFLNLEAGVRVNGAAASCLWSGNCMGRFVTVEANGDVAPCDKYVGAQGSILGNLLDERFGTILNSPRLRVFAVAAERAAQDTRQCQWHAVCRGGCPHDKYISELRGLEHERGCCGYAPLLDVMKSTARFCAVDAAS